MAYSKPMSDKEKGKRKRRRSPIGDRVAATRKKRKTEYKKKQKYMKKIRQPKVIVRANKYKEGE
tara:strand:- start:318 stop:509 length:192 start_codon:yes stop_codon:yes gene_type:complete